MLLLTPIPNHVYSCTWRPDTSTYLNLITDVSSTHIHGRCLSSTEPDYFDDNPKDAEYIEWKLSNWNEDAPYATITDLGHIDDFPELLL